MVTGLTARSREHKTLKPFMSHLKKNLWRIFKEFDYFGSLIESAGVPLRIRSIQGNMASADRDHEP